ncbi:MAG TPA: heavy metal translocating P-type ATPase [Opitutaceae bacterium]|nr:cadmium-translocating P-type ATPase [Opitutaceae bacterium]HRI81182.1 heavy metal translocating P-type ATPase [Opitutaceae bacterium]HRJ46310.1 heavy metal translocating P-type ATPase [Opitutaceae bacterium]
MSAPHEHTCDQEAAATHDHGSCGCDHGDGRGWESRSLALSGVLVGLGFVIRWAAFGPPAFQTALFSAAIVAGGWFLLPGAWRALRQLQPNIALLMVIAVIGASLIGEWAEAATVVFLFGIAEWLEDWADRRADRATRALLELAPDTARVREEDGRFSERPVGEVALGAIVSVQSGQRIPLDGVVTRGESAVNQAPITGESLPVEKASGATVFAGTINGQGSLEIEVTKAAGDTTLAKIIRLVEQAQVQKAPTQRFVDTFARYYTPLVTLSALLIFLVPPLFLGGEWSVWLYRACVLLIIACPCALVISTPVSIVAGLTALTRRGVLVKGGAHLETLAKLRALAVDKTGTITEGKPRVTDVTAFAPATADEVIRIAAAIDENSSHPLAQAVVAYAEEKKISPAKADNYQSQLGRGADATIDGRPCFVGNHRFAHELGVCTTELENRLAEIEQSGQSVVIVGHRPHAGDNGGVLGVMAVGDAVRPKAKAAIAALHAVGVSKVIMLSGDNQRTVDHIARAVGIDEARGDLLPDDKVAAVTQLREQHRFIAMVGDGVNDAPAMATASLGIAMGAAGTDAAIETADVALMQDDLGQIAEAIRLGQRTLGIIRFNITFSLGLKALFLGLALAGHTSLWLAIIADTGATLLVVANSLRLLRRLRK